MNENLTSNYLCPCYVYSKYTWNIAHKIQHCTLLYSYGISFLKSFLDFLPLSSHFVFPSEIINVHWKGLINYMYLGVFISANFFNRVVQKKTFTLISILRRNGTPPLFDVLPFEINIENYFLLIGVICTLFGNFPRNSVGWRVG